jgi:hypothetical protein
MIQRQSLERELEMLSQGKMKERALIISMMWRSVRLAFDSRCLSGDEIQALLARILELEEGDRA